MNNHDFKRDFKRDYPGARDYNSEELYRRELSGAIMDVVKIFALGAIIGLIFFY